MSKIEYDNGPIATQILPNINATISKLDSLINKCNEIANPRYGYSYAEFLNNFNQDVKSIKRDYELQRENLEDANKRLNNVIDNMNSDLLNIKEIEIQSRVDAL